MVIIEFKEEEKRYRVVLTSNIEQAKLSIENLGHTV